MLYIVVYNRTANVIQHMLYNMLYNIQLRLYNIEVVDNNLLLWSNIFCYITKITLYSTSQPARWARVGLGCHCLSRTPAAADSQSAGWAAAWVAGGGSSLPRLSSPGRLRSQLLSVQSCISPAGTESPWRRAPFSLPPPPPPLPPLPFQSRCWKHPLPRRQ